MIKIFYTSDIHGYVFPYLYHDNKPQNLGLAKVTTYINKNRDKNTIYIDNGDILEGSQLIDYYMEHKKGTHPMIDAMKIAGVDYVNIGNHDFNYGTKNLNEYLSNFKCLTTNLTFKNKPFGETQIITLDNKKIALIGVCTQHLRNWEREENLVDVEMYDACKTLKEEVLKVRKSVDYVIGIYHGGFEKDIKTGKVIDTLNGENEAYQMCMEIPELDVLLTGHQHQEIKGELNGVKILQPKMAGNFIGQVLIDEGKIEVDLIEPTFEAFEETTKKLSEIEEKTQKWLDEPIVNLKEDLLIKDGFEARKNKHKLVSLLNQIQLYYSQADFSAVALFNNATGFSKNLNMRELTCTYVYPNTLVVLKTNFQNLKLFLEKCAEYFTILENGEIGVDEDFYQTKPQHYNYDMVDGLSYTINVSKPKGDRVSNILVNNKPIDKEKMYTIVMNNYRAAGGGDFTMIKNMEVVKVIDVGMVKLIYEYLKEHKDNLVIKHEENIKVVK